MGGMLGVVGVVVVGVLRCQRGDGVMAECGSWWVAGDALAVS